MDSLSLEVERKFFFKPETELKLRDLGAELKRDQRICDRYFDNEHFQLTLADHWLRMRDGYWELKCPPGKIDNSFGPATHYLEITQEEDIICRVCKVLGLIQTAWISVADLVQSAGLDEFASFVTERKVYTLPCGSHVDLDKADFGYQIGEIEVLVSDVSKTDNALEKINSLAEKLGLTNTERIPGKMDAFLMQFRPLHYKKLQEAHIL
ncbi:thiamine-triphosphatase [Protopterus annectens]|uniref:thiamine-triphosphatase n=1 Tax=Protopterus annectens TaxID=7888 RepID=UPI001CFB40CB|nr:thiamine-triphosphatase [Protopterus annectens]XP_043914622.1 thiamine-triphosphatase [Protopterus annectens]XP_043914623.1 thiamine-triphosphatase [Protopterus annectens]